MPPAGELRDARPHDDELRRDDLERLLPVVADDLPLAVLRAGSFVLRDGQEHFDPRQVGRELLAAGRLRLLLATAIASDVLEGGVGDAFRGVRHVGRVAEVDRELIRIRQIPLDPLPEGGLQRGGEAELILGDLLLLLGQLLVLLGDERVLGGEGCVAIGDGRAVLGDRSASRAEQPVAGLEVGRKRRRLLHARIMQSTTQLTRADSASREK